MPKFKFYNIGKANAEIDRLEAELASRPKVSDDAAQLATQVAELTATNETISTTLDAGNKDLATAKQSIQSQTTRADAAEGQITAISTALRTSCGSLKLEVAADATPGVMITALENGVSSTLAKLNVPKGEIPNGKPVAAGGQPPKAELKGRDRMLAAMKIEGVK